MLDKIEQRIVDDIAEFGWHVLNIQPGEVDPRFSYTIGMMQTLLHPELVIVGLDDQTAGTILNIIGKGIRGGRPFSEPGLYEDVLKNVACKVRPVSRESHVPYLGYAMWHRRHLGHIGSLEAVQILWPDNAGRFPDEPGFDPKFVKVQKLL